MKKTTAKKKVLLVSGIGGGLFLFLLMLLLNNACGEYRDVCMNIYIPIAYLCFSFPVIFLLSLITYKMHDNVFRAWWSFARWFVPIIIIMTFILNNSGGGGTIGMNQDFTFFILGILYFILVIVSAVRITSAYGKKP
jgi:uncharacterized membrane protein YhaH (DUF805 family)